MNISGLCTLAKDIRDIIEDIQTIAVAKGYGDIASLTGQALSLMDSNTLLKRVLQGWNSQ
jgi:alkylated DNA nucleotide flippase Atl1